MIRVVEQYHDYQPRSYYIDPEKLNSDNYVDSEVLKALKKKGNQVHVGIDAHNWETDPKFNAKKYGEPGISEAAKVTEQTIEDRLIWLTIAFDC